MGLHRAEQSIRIAAPPEACFEAVIDYESFPRWQDAVMATDVLERYPDELARLVRVEVDARFRLVRYTLHYHYERPTGLLGLR